MRITCGESEKVEVSGGIISTIIQGGARPKLSCASYIIYRFVEKVGTAQEEAKETSIKEIGLMRDWFIDRIVKSDMKMKGGVDNKA